MFSVSQLPTPGGTGGILPQPGSVDHIQLTINDDQRSVISQDKPAQSTYFDRQKALYRTRSDSIYSFAARSGGLPLVIPADPLNPIAPPFFSTDGHPTNSGHAPIGWLRGHSIQAKHPDERSRRCCDLWWCRSSLRVWLLPSWSGKSRAEVSESSFWCDRSCVWTETDAVTVARQGVEARNSMVSHSPRSVVARRARPGCLPS